ncbi:MAG: hypothetical protein QOD25_2256, partial [Alphaproteobacteria bacterium]|nr:hypothetical protein [Alphaproteobacteria bacterium]
RINETPPIEVHLLDSGEKPGGLDHPVRRSSHLTPCSNPVLPIEKPDTGERPGLTGVARMLRRLLFASSIVLGLVFAAVCYAEMFGFD